MTNCIDEFWCFIEARLKNTETMLADLESGSTVPLGLADPRPGRPNRRLEVENLMRTAAAQYGHVALVTKHSGSGDAGYNVTAEIRFFKPSVGVDCGAVILHQASRLRATILLARFQLVGVLLQSAVARGPHLGYQQLYLPAPFV